MKQPRLGAAIALSGLLTVGGFTALPTLAVGTGASPPGGQIGETANDGTPSILGPSALTVAELRAWWTNTGRGQPPRLGIAIGDLIALYLSEGGAEGVRGRLGLAHRGTVGAAGGVVRARETGQRRKGHEADARVEGRGRESSR